MRPGELAARVAWRDKFAELWNAGESADVLRARFGQRPSNIANNLRRLGYALNDRRPKRTQASGPVGLS